MSGEVVVVTVAMGGAVAVIDAGGVVLGAAVPGGPVGGTVGGVVWVGAFPVGGAEDSGARDVAPEVAVGVGVDAGAAVAVSD